MERWRKIYLKFTGFSYSFNSSERSAARLAHLLWEQGVGSSNLPAPTQHKPRLKRGFYRSMDGLGIPDAHFHDLRRTFGYNLVKQEIQVSKLLSHASVATTEKPL